MGNVWLNNSEWGEGYIRITKCKNLNQRQCTQLPCFSALSAEMCGALRIFMLLVWKTFKNDIVAFWWVPRKQHILSKEHKLSLTIMLTLFGTCYYTDPHLTENWGWRAYIPWEFKRQSQDWNSDERLLRPSKF